MTKEAAKKEIEKLVNDYELHRNEYKQKGYDEYQFCIRILNRFFNALGWDVENKLNKSEWYCDTIFQFKLKNKDTTKRPDYAFGFPAKNNAKFFAEAKTPSTIIHTDKNPALQIRRYGNSGALPVSVVTNFEEFAIYDCTTKAKESDSPRVGRLEYFTYHQYSEKFDLLWELFSKEGIEQGYHDKYIKSETKKKGTVPLDKDFVATLDEWRKYLATSISHNNLKLINDEINFAVQQIIDRIIFLRFCEDRNIEKFETLLAVTKKGDYYKNLYELFKDADIKYNSGLFDFEKDDISLKIKVENKIIRTIIEELYYPKSEYEFGVMPVEILGNAYEEFLGKVIRVTPGHIVKIDIAKKPEVQKAGGVFYTPQYIVNYIVEHTVGKLINGKTPEQISKIKIVDPACGSGSFLLGAFIHLLRYHTDYYWKKNFHKKREKNYLITPEGRLTVTEKKRILQNNLFGVDIDPNAVEVTKLSLLLKAMEGETETSVGYQLRLDKKGVLPDLDCNIRCGNSLISPDFYDEQLNFDKNEKKKINAFDWKAGFPLVFKQGGFDAVIGNPPYVMLQNLERREIFDYALQKYSTAKYKIDTYQLFIERAINLTKYKGYIGYISPNTFLKNIHAEPLRKLFLQKTKINEILIFSYNVFKSASVDTCIFILEKNSANKNNKLIVKQASEEFKPKLKTKINQSSFSSNTKNDFNLMISDDDKDLLKKITSKSKTLGNFCDAYFGIQTFDRTVYVSDKKKTKNYVPVIDGGNIGYFNLNPSTEYVNFIPAAIKSGGNPKVYKQERICIRQIGKVPIATYVSANIYTLNTIYNVHLKQKNSANLKFLLGLICSNTIKYFWKKNHSDEKETYPKIKKEAILSIPIKEINNPNKKSKHDSIIRQVDNLLQLNKD